MFNYAIEGLVNTNLDISQFGLFSVSSPIVNRIYLKRNKILLVLLPCLLQI